MTRQQMITFCGTFLIHLMHRIYGMREGAIGVQRAIGQPYETCTRALHKSVSKSIAKNPKENFL